MVCLHFFLMEFSKMRVKTREKEKIPLVLGSYQIIPKKMFGFPALAEKFYQCFLGDFYVFTTIRDDFTRMKTAEWLVSKRKTSLRKNPKTDESA